MTRPLHQRHFSRAGKTYQKKKKKKKKTKQKLINKKPIRIDFEFRKQPNKTDQK
jgi:hypothetical protein